MTRQNTDAKLHTGPAPLDVSRFEPANRRRLSAPALRTFLAIAALWGLNEEQQRLILGYPSRSAFYNWSKRVREHADITLDADVLMRISAVFGIHQGLGVLFSNEHEGVAWLRRPHDTVVFGGQPPLSLITNGTQDGLRTVRRFVDAARGGLYMPPSADEADFEPYADSEIIFQ